MKVITATLTRDNVNYFESLEYDKKALEDLIKSLLSTQADKITKEGVTDETSSIDSTIEYYKHKLFEAREKFDIASKGISDTYLPKNWAGHDVDWVLDYSSGVCTFTRKCSCEIEELTSEKC